MSSAEPIDDYAAILEKQFSSFDISNFHVSFIPAKVFLCGGKYNQPTLIPVSLRDRLIQYFDTHDESPINHCVQAEDFKDYLKGGIYNNLLEFENDIAQLSTLIIICLESPGSLVEFGLFVNNKYLDNKLVVIAPDDKVEANDSFIYLGPLTELINKDPDSVLIYPWPNHELKEYEHLTLIIDDIHRKYEKTSKSQGFDAKNISHLVFLIYDIVLLCTPIKKTEIDLALKALGIALTDEYLVRCIYLLETLEMVTFYKYSNVFYYYVIGNERRRIKFGRDRDGRIRDEAAIKIAIRQSFVLKEDETSKKRRLAMVQINKKRGI